MSETIYVRNEEGGVHSVDQEHYDKYLTTKTNAGNTYILPGWKVISEADAKAAHPQLFGALDPQIHLSDDELIKADDRQERLARIRKRDAEAQAAAEQEAAAAAAAEEAKTPAAKTK